MREHERPGGSFDRFKRRPFAGMRAVHDDAHLVQPLHQVAAEAREARVAGLLAAVAHAIADIVGELHHAHAERVVRVHEVQVVLDRVGALEVENQPELLVLLGCGDVGRLPHQHEIGARVDQAVPAAEVAQGLLCRSRAAHGRGAGRDAPFDIPVDELLPAQQRAGAVDDDGFLVQLGSGGRGHIP